MNRTEKSILLYVETCCVDHGGLLEAQRMNKDDMDALTRLADADQLTWGRIPARFLPAANQQRKPTHWARLTSQGWTLAHRLRRERSESSRGPLANAVFEEVDNRATFNGDPDDQGAVRDFLNAHPEREASDGGRLG